MPWHSHLTPVGVAVKDAASLERFVINNNEQGFVRVARTERKQQSFYMVQGVKIVDGHLVSMDPATGAEVGRVRVSTPEQVDHAVEAAKAAQPAWEAVPLPVRVNILKEAVARLRAHANLARLITQEMGKILPEAEGEVYGALDKDRLLELIQQANQPEHVPGNGSVIYRAAHGVVALCTPWNFPVDEILLLALPALAAGNTVVVKPSEVTPLCGAVRGFGAPCPTPNAARVRVCVRALADYVTVWRRAPVWFTLPPSPYPSAGDRPCAHRWADCCGPSSGLPPAPGGRGGGRSARLS